MASKLKQLWWLMLIFAVCNVVMAVMLYQSSSPEPVNEDVVPIAVKNVYSIGILQSDDLAEQNKMTAGVLAALEAEGYSKGGRAKIDIVQAKGNDKKLEASAKKFARDKKDLIIAIGTDSAKAAVKATKNIPIVGVGVMNFKKDKDFAGYRNLTGIMDNPAILTQIRMASRCMSVKKLGILYNPGDAAASLQVEILREVAAQKGISLYEVAYQPDKAAEPQIQKLVGHITALYVPEDTDLLTHFDDIVKVMNGANIPIIGEQSEMVRRGALISVSPSYYRMGFSGGRMAASLLKGDLIPEDIPIMRQQDPDIVINMKQVNALNIPLPGDLWQRSRKLYLYDGQPARP